MAAAISISSSRWRRHPLPGETLLGTAYHEYPGGKGLNQVVAATRAGAAAAFVSALGDDAAGDRLAAVLAEEGIDAPPCNASPARRPVGR